MISKVKIVCDISFFYLDKSDPKGTILVECGKMLQRGTPKMRPKLGKDHQPIRDRHGNPVYETVKDKNGKVVYEPYRIKVLNTINFKKSMHYNPFAYLLLL